MPNSMSCRNALIALSATIVFCAQLFHTSNAQTYAPKNYYTFDDTSNPLKDSTGLFNIDPNYYGGAYSINTNSSGVGVGKYMSLGANGNNIRCGDFTTDSSVTIEFLFRPGHKFNFTRFFTRIDGAFSAKMDYPYILFTTTIKTSSGSYVTDDLNVTLNETGRKSWGYYLDGNWHHIVFRFNSNTGNKSIWIDGQCPTGFSKVATTGTFVKDNTVNKDFLFNTSLPYIMYYGDYDEIALYKYELPDKMVYQHYLDFTNRKHYTYANTNVTVPSPAATIAGVDITEFPPGHPNVTVSVTDQLKTFPIPRFKPGHTLIPNYSHWIDQQYFASRMQSGVSDAQAITNSINILTELAKYYNYMLPVSWNTDAFNTAWINLANQNPQYKTCLVTLRAQLLNNKVLSQSLPNDHYLQNSSGQFLDIYGNVTSLKVWRPTAPISSYVADGQATRSALTNALVGKLTRPVDFVNENGEVFPLIRNNAMALDPVVTAAKNSSGLDWENYLAKMYKDNATQAYRDQFMNLSIFNSNSKFSEYRIDGHRDYQFRFEQSRFIQTPINGMYYATSDFYVRWPDNWRFWISAWHGWQWMVESRKNELALGDSLFHPFIAAGWDANPEKDVRPAQWLGLLKCLNMLGAEFFIPCYFNEAPSYMPPNPPPYDPRGYAWQAAVPGYAQAIASRYESFLRTGTLLEGDVPNDYINPLFNAYNFWTGDQRKLAVVRKLWSKKIYAITGTIQPNSNMIGNAENESVATISLDGQSIKFKVRRQGSTYIYDNTNSSAPVFYQLDEWHEKTHPYYWTKDFNVEAELFDNTNSSAVIKTQVPSGAAAGDFTQFTSYAGFNAVSDLIYNFTTRGTSATTYYLWIRARSKSGTSTGMTITLDGTTVKTYDCIKDTNWVWYRYDKNGVIISFPSLSIADHQLKITAANTNIEIDKIALTTNSTALYGSATAPCTSTATATITASGPTTFCLGGNVVLTANSGTSYLWSSGATSQSITVTTSGSYTVAVTSAGGTATSSPTVVTVNALPTATITAGGATTFCQGNSVMLTASSNSSYLWSPGNQTTQSITVTASGSYSVKVTNANGCTNTSSVTAVTVYPLPTPNITAGGSTTFCSGGSVTLTSSSATTYLWSPGNQTTQAITATVSGTYMVKVTDANGCSNNSSGVTVTVNSGPTATITPSGSTGLCSGGSVTLTSSSGSSYLWSPGNQTTQSITVSAAGSYTVRVTGSNGCSTTSSPAVVTVSSPPAATITAGGPTTFCQGGSVLLTSSSGSAYLWSPGGETTQSISATLSGNYTVRVSNASGCSATSAAKVVTVNPAPAATITAGGPTTFCTGGSVVLTSSSGSSYLWSPGSQTTQSISVSSSGSYTVRVTGSNGCSATSAATVVTVSACTSCPIPSGLYTTNITSSSAKLNWSAVAGADSIQVRLRNDATGVITLSNFISGTSTNMTIAVSPGVKYYWRLRSKCGTNVTAWSPSDNFTSLSLRTNEPEPEAEITPLFESEETERLPEDGNNPDASGINVFPNPAHSYINCEVIRSWNGETQFKLLDCTGKIVHSEAKYVTGDDRIFHFDLSHLSKGIYLLLVNNAGQLSTKKIIIR